MKSRNRRRKPGRFRRYLRLLAIGALAFVAAVIAIDTHVVGSTRERIVLPADAPPAPVAVVLGASVYRDGSPSPVLADRLRTAAALYHSGRVPLLLVSGDRDPVREYDEVSVMKRELIRDDVPSAAILVDERGFRTLDSMYRTKRVFGFDTALVVTNEFHLPRAVFLATHFGIDAHGVIADPGGTRSLRSRAKNVGREVLARVLAWVECTWLDQRPADASEVPPRQRAR